MRDWSMVLLLLDTGLRVSKLIKLELDHVGSNGLMAEQKQEGA